MVKSIIKEIGIVILLLIAVAIVLAIILYDYIPTNKALPVKIQAYNIPEDIQNELKDSLAQQEENIVHRYSIDDTDLNAYESTNNYDKGKPNPFADYTTVSKENTSNSAGNNNADGNTNTNTNTDKNTNTNTDNNSNDNQNEEIRSEAYITSPGKNY